MNKILVIGLGGTIGSIKEDSIHLDKNCLKILDYCKFNNIEFVGVSPFSVLSENMTKELWQRLIDYIDSVDFSLYKGVIILHGSDTLAYTSSIIANAFPDKSIVLVASDKPIEDKDANGISNFNNAVEHILNNSCGVFVSYNGIKNGGTITSADIKDKFRVIDTTFTPVSKKKISTKNVLIVKAYVGINLDNYNLDNVDEVLIEMYHSATIPDSLKNISIPHRFVTHKSSADYETASDIDNILFSTTIENAYAISILE